MAELTHSQLVREHIEALAIIDRLRRERDEARAALRSLHDAVVRHGVTEGEDEHWLAAFNQVIASLRVAADVLAKAEGR